MLLFLKRLLLSFVQYAYLAQAGIVLTQTQNSLLFWGMRFFFLATPIAATAGKTHALSIVLTSLLLGNLLWSSTPVAGIVLLAFGCSTANFLVKKASAAVPKKSAWNKVAINLGGLLVGILLPYWDNKNETFTAYMLVPILLVWIVSLLPASRQHICIQLDRFLPLTRAKVGWLVAGMFTGFRVFGVYTIVSNQLKIHNALDQYALYLSIYSLMVILLQTPAIVKKQPCSLKRTIRILLLSLVVMSLYQWFAIHICLNGVVWLGLLALEEMVAPYIDFYANKAHAFLYKELGIALGGALCPLLFGQDVYTMPITIVCCIVLLATYLPNLKNYLGE